VEKNLRCCGIVYGKRRTAAITGKRREEKKSDVRGTEGEDQILKARRRLPKRSPGGGPLQNEKKNEELGEKRAETKKNFSWGRV